MVLFIALIGWQGFGSVASTLATAGWGLLAVAAFHLLPVVLDAGAISVLFSPRDRDVSLRDALLARWTGESVNSLMPAGQIGGPMMMVRYLAQRGMRARDAAAVITVSTTMQTIAQLIFALIGVAAARRRLRHERAHCRADRDRRDRRDDSSVSISRSGAACSAARCVLRRRSPRASRRSATGRRS